MISFDMFSPDASLPIYLQIILFIKRGIAAGTVTNGDELPSRRYLSALLGVNPNTVQKAYSVLSAEGLIISSAGAKSIVNASADKTEQVKKELLRSDIGGIVASLKLMGLTKEEAAELILKNWE